MSSSSVEIFSASALFSGIAAGPGQRVRLVDLLRLVSLLVMSDCSVRPLRRQAATIVSNATCHLPVASIIWGRPIEDEDDTSPIPQSDRIEKVAHPTVLLASPFIVRGNLHLAPEADPERAFDRLVQGFFPVTDATITYIPDESMSWESPVIVVNGAKVEAFGVEAAAAAAASPGPAAQAA